MYSGFCLPDFVSDKKCKANYTVRDGDENEERRFKAGMNDAGMRLEQIGLERNERVV